MIPVDRVSGEGLLAYVARGCNKTVVLCSRLAGTKRRRSEEVKSEMPSSRGLATGIGCTIIGQ